MILSTNQFFRPIIRQYGLFVVMALVFTSCISTRHAQKDKPFVIANKFEVITKGGNFSKDEIVALKSRMSAQLDDSARVNRLDRFFIFHSYNRPPAFDTSYAGKSARNIQGSMLHLGYYSSTVTWKVDTFLIHSPERKVVNVTYILNPGKPTIIDTFSYSIKKENLQQIALSNQDNGIIEQGKPVTKAAVLGEISRLVDLYRNNGYYKFTSEELRMQGDTSLSILTNISDDPFEQIQQLAEAQKLRDSPKIKLVLVLNPVDSNRLKQYYINNIYILPDYHSGDSLNDPTLIDRVTKRNQHIIIRFHNKLFRTGFLLRKLTIKSGDLYNQSRYYETFNNFSRAGVWQTVNIDIREVKDSSNKIDLVIQLLPTPQFAFETALETSYSATSNTNSVTAANAGNLLGLSGNVSITNRNWLKEGIRMTTALRTGVELNIRPDSSNTRNIINSNDVSLSNTILFPRAFPFKKLDTSKKFLQPETFINTNLSYINRINLFNLQSINLSTGWNWHYKNGAQVVFKLINFEFTRLYNATDSFKKTLDANPFLRYSFNTALVAGASASYSLVKTNPRHPGRQTSIKFNAEESGFPYWQINVLHKYLRRYGKFDAEYTHSRSKAKSAFVFRAFAGVGIASKSDTTLPFFKQYFGGGSNSMRGWPIRGIGRGSQPLAPFGTNQFNDRTGDIRFEINNEYRFNIARIIPNTLQLRGAFFVDAGNIWNLRNSKPGGGTDSAQFSFSNFYRDLGVNVGPGLRFDFNYFVVRFDFGFRLKRPELAYTNDGWKIPALGFDDVFKKVFARGTNDEYRRWRYENFNFTIGINYPFSF